MVDLLAISKSIGTNFFNLISKSKSSAYNYYCEESCLLFNGKEIRGKDNISSFWESKDNISYKGSGYDAQFIPGSSSWVTVVVLGTVKIDNSAILPFYSSNVVCVNTEERRGFIVNQTISIYE